MSEYMTGFTDTGWTVAGFFIFFILFLIFVGTTFLPSQKKIHEDLSQLPLQENNREVQG